MKAEELFSLDHTAAKELLSQCNYPWEALATLNKFIKSKGVGLDRNEYNEISSEVWVHKSAIVANTAHIGAPCIIGAGTQVRHCAFIRGSAVIGENCIIGNSTEIKNSVVFDNVQIPHFNYVGDSILGYAAHMGAGAITSNVKSDRSVITVRAGGEEIFTSFKKLGAMIGDYAEVGCNSVLNPGCVIGRRASVYPLSCVRGYIPPDCIFKDENNVVKRCDR